MHLNDVARYWKTTLYYSLALAEFLLTCIFLQPKKQTTMATGKNPVPVDHSACRRVNHLLAVECVSVNFFTCQFMMKLSL